MGAPNEMSLAFERHVLPSRVHPNPRVPDKHSGLNVVVVFTSVKSTIQALRTAGALANKLSAHITLLVPQIVPYPLPITSPPVLLDFSERRFHVIARESPVETTVRIYLCRDRREALAKVLRPHSVVVIGGHKRWWPTAEKKTARQLRRAGHEVILVETE